MVDEDAVCVFLAVQTLALLDEDHDSTHAEEGGQEDKGDNKSEDDVEDDESYQTATYRAAGPVDVAAL